MKKIKNLILIILLINICFSLTACKKDEKNELKEKVISELGYVNIKILDILNGLNNITFESYTIISKEVRMEDESQTKKSLQGQNGGSENQETGNGNSSEGQGQQDQRESQDLINTTEMVTDTILSKNKEDIKWDTIKSEIELLNESWNIIILDLYSLNVKNETILDFSTKLNKAMIAIKNEDKKGSLITLADLYQNIPQFLREIDADKNLQKIRQTQSYVINSYALADDLINEELSHNLQKAIDVYSEIISNIDYTKDKTYKTNKIYVLLNELANSVKSGDSNIFYVKYRNFMEAINEL